MESTKLFKLVKPEPPADTTEAVEEPIAFDPTESPYKGLVPYSEEDAAFFFGRENDQHLIIANLRIWRLTLFYGQSGVGKSSVLQAGVAPKLRAEAKRNMTDEGEPGLAVVTFNNWRDEPLSGLTRAVELAVQSAWNNSKEFAPLPNTSLERVLQVWADRVRGELFILLDQFEEYFLYHPNEDGPGTFGYEFARVVNNPQLPVHFLLSIREDALSKLDFFKGRIIALFDNLMRLEQLDAEAGREAIVKPLQQYNRLLSPGGVAMQIEPGLVNAVLEQVKTGQVALQGSGRGTLISSDHQNSRRNFIETPYLQLVLTRLWEEETLTGSHTMRLETLEKLNGAVQIVRTHLDKVMKELPPAELRIAVSIFQYLVTSSGTKIAYSAADLADLTQLDFSQIAQVLEKLSQSGVRILRPVAPPAENPNAQTRYEIFHDVLGAAILDWRRRYIEQQRLEAQLEQSKLQARKNRERIRHNTLQLLRFPFAFGPLLLVLAILALTTDATGDYKQNSYTHLNQHSSSGLDDIVTYIDSRGKETQSIALDTALVTADQATSSQLAQNLLNTYGFFSRIIVTDARGIVKIDNGSSSNSSLVGQNVSRQNWYSQALTTSLWISGPITSTQSNQPAEMLYSAPMKDGKGNFLGLVNLRLPFSKLSQLLDDQPHDDYIEMAILDSNGNILYLPAANSILANGIGGNNPPIKQLFAQVKSKQTQNQDLAPNEVQGEFSLNHQNCFYVAYSQLPYPQASADWIVIAYGADNLFYFDDVLNLLNLAIVAFIVGVVLLIIFRFSIPAVVAALGSRDDLFELQQRSRWRTIAAIIVASVFTEGLIIWYSFLTFYLTTIANHWWDVLLGIVCMALPLALTINSLIVSFRRRYSEIKSIIVVGASAIIGVVIGGIGLLFSTLDWNHSILTSPLLILLALILPEFAAVIVARFFRYAGF